MPFFREGDGREKEREREILGTAGGERNGSERCSTVGTFVVHYPLPSSMKGALASHPYYPLDAQVDGYAANESSLVALVLTASAACTALLGATFALVSLLRPSLCRADRIATLWFVLCMYGS